MTTLDGLPVVEGWHRPKLGGRLEFWFLLLFGLLMLLAGVAMSGLGDADDRGPGIVIAFFGLGLVLSSPLFRTWKRRGRPGIASVDRNGHPDTGLSFPYSRYKTRASAIAMICMGAASCGLAISPESFADPGESTTTIRIVGTLGAILLGGIGTLVLIRKAGAGWHVTLLPSGVAAVAAGTTSFVPWDAIDSIAAFDFTLYTRGFANHEPYIGINATDPDRIEISKTGRMLMKTNKLLGTDLAYPVRALDVEPALLYHALSITWSIQTRRPSSEVTRDSPGWSKVVLIHGGHRPNHRPTPRTMAFPIGFWRVWRATERSDLHALAARRVITY